METPYPFPLRGQRKMTREQEAPRFMIESLLSFNFHILLFIDKPLAPRKEKTLIQKHTDFPSIPKRFFFRRSLSQKKKRRKKIGSPHVRAPHSRLLPKTQTRQFFLPLLERGNLLLGRGNLNPSRYVGLKKTPPWALKRKFASEDAWFLYRGIRFPPPPPVFITPLSRMRDSHRALSKQAGHGQIAFAQAQLSSAHEQFPLGLEGGWGVQGAGEVHQQPVRFHDEIVGGAGGKGDVLEGLAREHIVPQEGPRARFAGRARHLRARVRHVPDP